LVISVSQRGLLRRVVKKAHVNFRPSRRSCTARCDERTSRLPKEVLPWTFHGSESLSGTTMRIYNRMTPTMSAVVFRDGNFTLHQDEKTMKDVLGDFVDEVESVMRDLQEPKDKVLAIEPLLRCLVTQPDWLQEKYRRTIRSKAYAQYLLYRPADRSFS